ncbi:ilv operon leader peptide [Escherichia coli]|nr:ilv operon leader peptide [Escherichia coli]
MTALLRVISLVVISLVVISLVVISVVVIIIPPCGAALGRGKA